MAAWNPLQLRWIKVNVDVTCKEEYAACAIVIKDYNDSLLYLAMTVISCNPTLVVDVRALA